MSSSPPIAKIRSSGSADSIQIAGALNGRNTSFVLDSGANRTLIRASLLTGVPLPQIPGGLSDVTGRRSPLYGPTEVSLEIGGVSIRQTVYAADHLSDDVILGLDFLKQNHCVLDFQTGLIRIGSQSIPFSEQPEVDGGDRFPPRALRIRVLEPVTVAPGMERLVRCKPVGQKFESLGIVEAGTFNRAGLVVGRSVVDPRARSVKILVANVTESPIKIRAGTAVGTCEEVELLPDTLEANGEDHNRSVIRTGVETLPTHLARLLDESSRDLTSEQSEKVRNLLSNYSDVFSSNDQDLGQTSVIEHRIDTGESRPVKTPPRRIPIHKRQEVEDTVKQLNEQGLIEPSSSPWSSALVLVRKKDGSLRCCVDYRRLNAVTIKDSYPLPRIDDTLDALSGSNWFSTLDLKSGYHQVALAEKDKPKTAFSTGNNLWQWRVLPFGVCNGPATFERLMDSVLAGMHWQSLLVYLDDIIVFGRSFSEELQRLEDVFRRMKSANLKLNPKKCLLFRPEVRFLGHIVSRDGVRTDPVKTAAVAEWPVPSNVKELRSFLGLCTYYRRFVRGFANLAAPLYALTKEGVRYKWNKSCQESFDMLKSALEHAPVLQYPDTTQPFILDTDASATGIGAVLSQIHDGVEHVVAFFSRTLTAPEKNYCVTRRELLAIVESVRHFHQYLYGSKFTIRSDHSALQWLQNLKDPEGQLARWLARLGQYDYHVRHRPGQQHINADALSRRPCSHTCRHCSRHEAASGNTCRLTKITSSVTEGGQQDIRSAQRSDTELAPLMRLLEHNINKPDWNHVASTSRVTKIYWTQWEQLRVHDGILQRRWESKNGVEEKWLNVIPQSLKKSMLAEAHGSVASGHFGVKRTLQRLRKCGYWVRMREDVKEWCRVCEECVAKKGPLRAPQAPLQILTVGAPMERVAVDVAGPFPVSSSGNRYIVVAIDYFSKWPEAFAVPNQEAATVARVLVDGFFCRFGMPEELHSDQGRNFESALFRECCQLLGIRKTRTTPLHPESDGMVERFNRTLVQEMAKRCRHGQSDWDLFIPTILMAYRSAEHESTGYTPAQLMIGQELRMPLDLLFEKPPDTQECTTTEFVRAQRDRMRIIRAQVENNLRIAASTMKRRTDVKATSLQPLEENDQVWLYNPKRKKGQSPKLSSSWDGPYRIVKRLSAVTYRIQKHKHAACKVVHFNRLWKIGGPPKFSWTSGSGGSDTSTPDRTPRDAGIIPTLTRAPEDDDGTIPNPRCIASGDTGLRSGDLTKRDIPQTDPVTPKAEPSPSNPPDEAAGDRIPAAAAPHPRRSQRPRRPPVFLRYN